GGSANGSKALVGGTPSSDQADGPSRKRLSLLSVAKAGLRSKKLRWAFALALMVALPVSSTWWIAQQKNAEITALQAKNRALAEQNKKIRALSQQHRHSNPSVAQGDGSTEASGTAAGESQIALAEGDCTVSSPGDAAQSLKTCIEAFNTLQSEGVTRP
ncbi:MAG: hypothetical protein ACREUA_09990, partial [Burkholderiales bacterium]